MANFITTEDYNASIHQEILDAVIRSDATIVEVVEDRAIAEMRGYMSRRYDCDKIFSAEGEQRHQLVLMMAIDITIYHLFCIHNPRMMSEIRVERYERAIKWLEGVRDGNITVDGLPEVASEVKDYSSQFQVRSNKKRNNNI
ncbi:MAG: DUF1320 domain-containing protein [Alistipes sp.]|nr:DUF1320 domain-containing protein [Alistipes sp.]MBR3590474.1 DUF1320 domain-containing protein [Alistipes sp.]